MDHVRAAAHVITKGSMWPFNRVPPDSSGVGGDKMARPYAQSTWLLAAIRHIAGPIAGVQLEFTSASGARNIRRALRSGAQAIHDPRLELFWQSPAKGLTSLEEFIRATVGWRKMAGEAFWILDDTSVVPYPAVRDSFPQMILARPDRMRHVVNKGELVGWDFTDGGGMRHTLLPEQVIQLKQWNPYSEFRGLGEYEAAQIAANTDYAAGKFSLALMQANGDQGAYIVCKNGMPTEEQRLMIISQLREKRQLQASGVFRPAFLVGDISVEDPQIRAVDAAFQEGRRMSAEEIYTALGVPQSMASKTASYSIGSASDYFRLILDGCMPEGKAVASAISQVSSKLAGRTVTAYWDWDEHPVMQEVRRERLKNADGLWAKGMPLNKVSEYLDLELPRFDGDDTGYLPMNVVAVSELTDPASNVDFNESGPDGPKGGSGDASTDPVKEAMRALTVGCVRGRDANELALAREHMTKRMPVVKSYKSAFNRVLMAARGEVLRKLEARKTVAQKSGAADFQFNLAEFQSSLDISFRKVSANALATAGEQLFEELGFDDPFTYPPEAAMQFMRQRENKLSGVSDEVWQEVSGAIQLGMEGGDTITQIADKVRGVFNEISRGRATTIAMTETAAAYGTARQAGMVQAGVKYKKWLTSGAPNVRPAHASANKQTVEVDEAFEVGGEELMHPGDPRGSAGNVINCHCVAIAVAIKEDGED